MPLAPSANPESWIAATVTRLWPGCLPHTIVQLKGDASSRRFWRVSLDRAGQTPASAIAIDLGPDDLPRYARVLRLVPEPLIEPPWLNLHRFLTSVGVAVPALYAADLTSRMLLVEDVGTLSLFDAAQRSPELYRLAAEELLLLHEQAGRACDQNCLAARIAYDQRLFRWELEQFLEAGIEQVAPGAERVGLADELDRLAAGLDGFPRVFSHRDYHGHNLFVQSGQEGKPKLRVIDFQDALMAPAAQDLAVLLTTRDTAHIVTPRMEQRVLDYYYAAHIRRRMPQLPFEQFHEGYRLCVLQHALKMVGRFVILEREGKRGYGLYIPFAVSQARRMLALSPEFPRLRAALGNA